MDSLRGLLIDELADLYSAEKLLIAALPKMTKPAASENPREAIESHLEEGEAGKKLGLLASPELNEGALTASI